MTYENQIGRLSFNEMEFIALNIYIYVVLFVPIMAMEFNWERVRRFYPTCALWLLVVSLEAVVFGFFMNQPLSMACVACVVVMTFIVLIEALVLVVGMAIFGPKANYMVKFEDEEE